MGGSTVTLSHLRMKWLFAYKIINVKGEKMMNLIIRKAKVADKDEIFSLVKDCTTSFKPEKDLFIESIKNILENDSALLLVAEVDNQVVGYSLGFIHYTFYANGRVAWLEEIMVNEKFRRKKIGESLIKGFEKWAKLKNSKLIALATRRAAAFYNSIGYEESARYFRKLL